MVSQPPKHLSSAFFRRFKWPRFALLLSIVWSNTALASDPFESCPSEAFLIQDTVARLYGVNLATGYYAELSTNLGTSDKINALAFNFHDNYLYGWGYEFGSPVRIGNDFQVSPIAVQDLPGANFYVGDIAIERNVYYVYKNGANYGLYAIDLDPADGSAVRATRVVDGSSLNLRIFDMAFHPSNGFAYAVDRDGLLHEIDVAAGTSQLISDTGVSGTFGATYFDVEGTLYVSRNSDGNVFRIDLTALQPVAEFYAYGPSSGNNDGARCALAPLVDAGDTDIDFGDAPDSYGTTLENNGARHDIGANNIYLGAMVDGESNSFTFPLSDDAADNVDDEDGIQFVTSLELGRNGILIAEASEAAYLNAWIDWNQNGLFDDEEQIISQYILSSGDNQIVINTPIWAEAGSTWARFRLSSTASVGPTGGVGDGEVEDYAVNVVANGVTETYFPSAGTWSTVAYEDNWPVQGDYDMNDLVVHLRSRELSLDNNIVGLEISGEIVAVGGIYHNGFAIRLPGVNANTLQSDSIRYWINEQEQIFSPLESEQGEIIFVIANDAWDYVSPGEGCVFYRSEVGCESDIQMQFKLRASFGLGVASTDFPSAPYDPFMYATPGYAHGALFANPPGRGLEIHLPGQTPTDLFNTSLLGMGDDRSDVDSDHYFRTEAGMPWALHIANDWQHPFEFIDITQAYPLFESYVTSAGSANLDWYLPENADPSKIFTSE